MGDVTLTVDDGGLGIAPANGDEQHAVIGCSDAGTDGSYILTRDPNAMIASKGYGPLTEASALNALIAGLPLFCCKVPSATPGFVIGSTSDTDAPAATTITSSTDATPIVVTDTAHGYNDGDVITIAGHTTNTPANGTHVIHVLTDNTYALLNTVGVGAGAAGTAVSTGVNVQTPGTSVPTITGAPNDSRAIRFRFPVGGTKGSPGATFQYSKDGGATYSAVMNLGNVSSYTIPNTGVTINFGTGTFLAGEIISLKTREPHWAIDDVVTMLQTLKASGQKFRLIELVGEMTAADAVTLATKLEDLKNGYRYTRLIGHARDINVFIDSDQADYEATLSADVVALDTPRVSIAAGYYRCPSAIDQSQYRRPFLFQLIARIMSQPIQVSPGKVRLGAILNINTPSQSDIDSLDLDNDLYIDGAESPALNAARYITARTRVGRPGWFCNGVPTMAGPTSDFTFLPLAFVIDKACDITYEWLVDLLDDDVQLDPTTGKILEQEARAEEARGLSLFNSGMVAAQNCTSVTPALSRDDNILSTKTINAKVRVLPRGYLSNIVVDVGYTNPELAIAGS